MIGPYEITSADVVYRVEPAQIEGTVRIGIYSDGQLRFSLPDTTSLEEVDKFVHAYALGFADGKRAQRSIEDQLRDRFKRTAQRLGRAAGTWKTGTK
jgi:hypothetical protein